MKYQRRNTPLEEITGTFHSGREAKPGFFIGNLATKNGLVAIVGEATQTDFSVGSVYRFSGYFAKHPTYGRQFRFDSFTMPEPNDSRAMVRYLQQCRGIGTARAEKLVQRYGTDTLEQIRENPVQVAMDVQIDVSILTEAAEWLKSKKRYESATLELSRLLDGKGFPRTLKKKLLDEYGEQAAAKVRENPFLLMNHRGVGFQLADMVWQSIGGDLNSPFRQSAYVRYLIESNSSGSTWLDYAELYSDFQKQFPIKSAMLDYADIITTMDACGEIWWDGRSIVKKNDYNDEQSIRENIERLTQPIAGFQFTDPSPLSPHQRKEAERATSSTVGILAGSPGTGKTYTAAQIIKQCDREQVAVAAPTGKAALRITEAMHDYGIPIQATTIHGLLGSVRTDTGWDFDHGPGNPIDARYIFVDESSMVDTWLMSKLLGACATGTRLLFIGDPDQLPPVGKGAPLRDFLSRGEPYGITVGKLSEIQRNSGAIVQACQHICNGQTFEAKTSMPDADNNLVYTYESVSTDNVVQLLRRIGEPDPMQLQIVVAMNTRGNCSRKALNEVLQAYYNGQAPASDRPWKCGDKVICMANGTAKTLLEEESLRISNGDIGRVTEIRKGRTIVLLNNVEIIIPRVDEKWSESDWDLGYAITCHKSQGSEWPRVVVVLDPLGVQNICDRHWIYTAISRAKRECYLIGSASTASEMVQKTNMWERKTGLLLSKGE